MEKIKSIKFLGEYNIQVVFKDEFTAEIDFSVFIDKGISLKLKEMNYFQKAYVDEYGALTWPNGYDFDPDFLRQYSIMKNIELINH